MKPSHLAPFAALVACGLAGCITPPKPGPARTPDTDPAVRQVGVPATFQPDPNDPLPPGLSPKLTALLTNQGLSNTPAKPGEAARLIVAWENKIIYAPDPTRGGEAVPGLLAKVYLFGPDEKIPVKGNGELLVAAWDNTPKAGGGPPRLMELWHIDPEAARKLQRPDFMAGHAYTLFLPFSNYNIDLKQINIVVRYDGADGRNLVASPEKVTIDHSETLQRAAEKLGANRGAPQDVPLLQPVPTGGTGATPQAAISK
jgi:hypothetical protein